MESYMYKAAFLTHNTMQSAPTAKEIKTYLGKSAKLLYGNDQRKSKNTPYSDKLHTIEHSFSHFKNIFTNKKSFVITELYIFDDKINETHFLLKYAPQVLVHFIFDEKTIDEMHTVSWNHGHLTRYLESIDSHSGSLKFFIEKNIGDANFHKLFPSFLKKFETIKLHTQKEIDKLEKKADLLFRSGW
jgi:hypothetical protein